MIEVINGGVYQVDLQGSHDAEFCGKHPSIILRNLKEYEMYYIIPLTTFEEEKWKRVRKNLCCRIKSTNSIARIDKMQVRHKDSIPNRWFSSNKILYPTVDEIKEVYDHLEKYLSLSIEKSKKEYQKHYENYKEFKQLCSDFFTAYNFSQFSLEFQEKQLIAKCDLALVRDLTLDDIKDTIKEHIFYRNFSVKYDKNSKLLIIIINMQDKNALTLKAKYDIIMPTEEQSE